jgi:hypothetical protein
VSAAEIVSWLLAAVQGGLVGAAFLLAVIIGASVLLGLVKLHHRGRAGARSLDELVGEADHVRYLPPDAPHGPIDQLRAGTSGGRLA